MFECKQFLPQWLYEGLRWVVSIVLPATATLLAGLNAAWNWGWPIEAILATFSAVETFLGAVFLGAKIVNDRT
jgi:hypothetical protein